MTVRDRLHELIDALPEESVKRLMDVAEKESRDANGRETPEELFQRLGPWQDSRTTEEIIRDLYESRTSSEVVDL